MKKIVFILIVVSLGLPLQVLANTWKIDPVHSNFYFDIQHIYSTVRGQFAEFTGEVFFDPEVPEKSSFDFEIKVDSMDTKIGKRDTHLRSSDFFDSGRYPLMIFKSKEVRTVGGNKYIVDGTLTIKDVSRNLALEFDYHGQKENPLKAGEMVAGLDARLVIDRLEYHVGDGKFFKMGAVGKDVSIMITLELLRDK